MSKTFYENHKDEQTDTNELPEIKPKRANSDNILDTLRNEEGDSDNGSLFSEMHALKQEKDNLKQIDSVIKHDKEKL